MNVNLLLYYKLGTSLTTVYRLVICNSVASVHVTTFAKICLLADPRCSGFSMYSMNTMCIDGYIKMQDDNNYIIRYN